MLPFTGPSGISPPQGRFFIYVTLYHNFIYIYIYLWLRIFEYVKFLVHAMQILIHSHRGYRNLITYRHNLGAADLMEMTVDQVLHLPILINFQWHRPESGQLYLLLIGLLIKAYCYYYLELILLLSKATEILKIFFFVWILAIYFHELKKFISFDV